MDFPPLLDDLAFLFSQIFGLQVAILSGALIAGSLLFSFSIVAVGIVRGRD